MQKVEIDSMMRGHILSDDIEDVEYVDVSDAPKVSCNNREKPSFDKEARAKEVVEFAKKQAEEMNKTGDLVIELFFMILILFGAEWADSNPVSKFHDDLARRIAFSKKLEEKNKEMEGISGKNGFVIPCYFILCRNDWVLMG